MCRVPRDGRPKRRDEHSLPSEPFDFIFVANTHFPIQALYRKIGDRKEPLFAPFIKFEATSSRPQNARVDTSSIVIISIRLSSLSDIGSPAQVVHSILMPYYPDNFKSHLVYLDMPYSIGGQDEAILYKEDFERKLSVLKEYESSYDS